ncbi:hypothetical protein Dvina_48530 [Dactylosporangium vinaceum]|uniref:Integral membrane protein n=1 Tax=Dactylosporangium vinaceum TaxID=53362 RepID=A0ABV5MP19_9ACTN|nr:hypothetical protein [Dactylosporangium vinaceum]UAB95753.1 hypothetical protein Dvina_48530 [Dactylosporangium vinaceum]
MEETRAVIPLRPLTFGELLDGAVSLLRAQAPLLLLAALGLAAIEQALLYPLRQWANLHPPAYTFDWSRHLGAGWLVFCAGMSTEAAILALLGGFAGAAAGPGLLGQRARPRDLLRQVGRRALPLLVIALAAAPLVFVTSLVLMLPWPWVYGLFGLAAPALMVDRVGPFRAIGRSFKLAGRGLRGVFIRVGAYVSWAAIRLALGVGGSAVLGIWWNRRETGYALAMIAVWAVVDAVAYATLACIDAVLYLEVRMRVEGLDVAIGRLRRLDRPIDLAGSVILGAAVR